MRRRRSKNNIPLVVTYASVLALCIGGAGYAALQLAGKRAPDRLGCFDGIEQPQTLVFVDASEPRFDRDQTRSLKRYFTQLFERSGFNERLSFFTSEGDQMASVARPRFHVCGQAASPQQLEAVNAGAVTDGYLKKQRERLFEKVLKPELDTLLSADVDETRRQRQQSPILEMVADLSRLPEMKPGSRLVIVSDLINNSESARFCVEKGAMPPFSQFKQRSVYGRVKPQSLKGIDVDVLMLQREGYGQSALPHCSSEEELKIFWRDYFEASGVEGPRFIRIRHGMEG